MNTELILKRSIAEIRFPPSLTYNRIRDELFSHWIPEYMEVRRTNQLIELVNSETFRKIFCTWDRAGLAAGNVESFPEFRGWSSSFLINVHKAFNFQGFHLTRIGARNFFLLPCNSFDEMRVILEKSLAKERWLDVWGDRIDIGFSLILKIDDRRLHVSFGPVTREELGERGIREFEYEQDPEYALLFDGDYYQNFEKGQGWDLKSAQYDGFIELAYKSTFDKIQEFVQLLKE